MRRNFRIKWACEGWFPFPLQVQTLHEYFCMDKERTDLEKRKNRIEIHCRKCNQRLMDYTLSEKDETIVLQGITIKCTRCKRMLVMKKYTEGVLRKDSRDAVFRM